MEPQRDGIKQQLIETIDVVDFVRQHTHPDWNGEESQKLTCPMATIRHEGGDDSSPSLSINPTTGAFKCFGCGWKGTSIIGYYTDVKCDGNFNKALAVLFNEHIRQTFSLKGIKEWHTSLMNKPSLVQKIAATRGWTPETLRRFKIGWDTHAKRASIPIFNLAGYVIDLRFHDSLYRAELVEGKRVSVRGVKASRTGDFFPLSPAINPLLGSEIWLVEGEPDAILGTQDGLNCITVTGGAGAWASLGSQSLKVFAGKDIIICLDADKAGQDAAAILAKNLSAVGVSSLKNTPVPDGKDLSDFFLKHGGSAQQLKQYAAAANYLIKPQRRQAQLIPLAETSKAEHIGKTLKSQVIVSGKQDSPLAIPKVLKLACGSADKCSGCPCASTGTADYFVPSDDPDVLNWLYCKSHAAQVKDEMHLPKSCPMKVDVVEWQNLESLTLIPSLSTSRKADEGAYAVRRGYYSGHGIETNQNYEIEAIPAVHPRSKESVLLVNKASGTHDSLENFHLTTDELSRLKGLFNRPAKETILEIVQMFSANVTHIYGRNDLHIAVDLAFHSVRGFTFAEVSIPKGSMELLVFGDTRCGKGQVAEGLIKYYDMGAVVSGENASFMGLCGGAQKVGDGFQICWGAIPLNNGRIVVIDEFSGLSSDVLGRLSRVRSEGIAEINKGGINTRTRANTRLIWVANPRNGREVSSFVNGVSAIMDLIGTNEDVARFDLAVVVQKNEVDIHKINTIYQNQIQSRFSQEDLRKVVLWAWSRKEEHIIFTRQATEYILQASNELAAIYSATIPLIQGENARFKLAKIAAAIAARTFSTEDGIFLKVTEHHAKLAVSLIHMFYNKGSMGYRQFSEVEVGTQTLVDIHILDDFFKRWPKQIKIQIIDGLLSVEKFSTKEIQDWCDVDGMVAKKFAGSFVRCQAIKQLSQGMYAKKAAFINYLKKLKKDTSG